MMKYSRLTAAVLVTALSAFLVACGSKSADSSENSTATVNMTVSVETTQSSGIISESPSAATGGAGTGMSGTDTVNTNLEMTADTAQIAGIKTDKHYENALFHISAEIPDTYVIYADEDLGQEYGSQEEIQKALADGKGNFLDLVAQDAVTSENIQIFIAHVTSMKDKGKTLDDWLATSMESYKKSLASQGATDIAAEITTTQFAGEETQAIHITSTISEKQIEQQLIYMLSGDYIMTITLSAMQGRIPLLQGFFYGS